MVLFTRVWCVKKLVQRRVLYIDIIKEDVVYMSTNETPLRGRFRGFSRGQPTPPFVGTMGTI